MPAPAVPDLITPASQAFLKPWLASNASSSSSSSSSSSQLQRVTSPVFAIPTPFLNSRGPVSVDSSSSSSDVQDYPYAGRSAPSSLDTCDGTLKDHVKFTQKHGVEAIIVGGTTAEFPSISLRQRWKDIQTVIGEAKKANQFVIVHVSFTCLTDLRQLLDHARDTGADAVLILPPYYFANVPSQGIEEFLDKALSDCTDCIPAFLYHFPKHTGNAITPEMYGRLAKKHENCLLGIKDSGGNLQDSIAFQKAAPNLRVIVGNDRGALDVLKAGLSGSVTGAMNPAPELLMALYRAFVDGKMDEAEKAQGRINEWHDALAAHQGMEEIPLVKAGMSARIEAYSRNCRAPLLTASPAVTDALKAALHKLLGDFDVFRRTWSQTEYHGDEAEKKMWKGLLLPST